MCTNLEPLAWDTRAGKYKSALVVAGKAEEVVEEGLVEDSRSVSKVAAAVVAELAEKAHQQIYGTNGCYIIRSFIN